MQHALDCFVRLVKIFLGPEAISDKVSCGAKLVVLGIEIDITERGFQCRPSADKVEKWSWKMKNWFMGGMRIIGRK